MKLKAVFYAGVFAAMAGSAAAEAPAMGQSSVEVLIEEKLIEDFDGLLPSDAEIAITTDQEAAHGMLIEHWSFDRQTGRFIAAVQIDDQGSQVLRLSGRAQVMVPTLVPNRRLAAGEIITERDLAEIRIPLGLVASNMLRDATDIIGKEVRRTLMQERPIQGASLIEPRAVLKGEDVEINYELNGMKLTAAGKATQEGAIGDEIRILNKTSRKHVMAEIVAPGRVAISTQSYAQ